MSHMKSSKLTFFESVMLVAGAGIGTGILTIPYAVAKIGTAGTLVALALAYGASALLYLVLADLTRHSAATDLMGILDEHLFFGKRKKLLHALFLLLLVLLLLENLVVYILCAGNVIGSLWGLSPVPGQILFYLLASLVVLFGVKGMGVGEKISVLLIGLVVLLLTVLSGIFPKGAPGLGFGDPSVVFAVYGLFMFAFSAIFSIIQVCRHIEKPALAGKAILGGLTVNALITLTFSVATVLGSETITEIATVGLSEGLPLPWIRPLCALMVLFAMLTSFWSSGFAFADVVKGQSGLSLRLSWLIATLPALLIALILPLGILDYVQIGAGALSIILIAVVLPAYAHAVKGSTDTLMPRAWSGRGWLIALVALAILLMTVSSFMPIP